jgi:hypothetical protein
MPEGKKGTHPHHSPALIMWGYSCPCHDQRKGLNKNILLIPLIVGGWAKRWDFTGTVNNF